MRILNETIEKRILDEAEYIIEHRATTRDTAKQFHVSKTTVSRDMSVKLKDINRPMYYGVRIVTEYNLCQRASRGGQATRRTYLRRRAARLS
jgi:putative DeoR family transcriptional regulator (stage III sporulation protein D)